MSSRMKESGLPMFRPTQLKVISEWKSNGSQWLSVSKHWSRTGVPIHRWEYFMIIPNHSQYTAYDESKTICNVNRCKSKYHNIRYHIICTPKKQNKTSTHMKKCKQHSHCSIRSKQPYRSSLTTSIQTTGIGKQEAGRSKRNSSYSYHLEYSNFHRLCAWCLLNCGSILRKKRRDSQRWSGPLTPDPKIHLSVISIGGTTIWYLPSGHST